MSSKVSVYIDRMYVWCIHRAIVLSLTIDSQWANDHWELGNFHICCRKISEIHRNEVYPLCSFNRKTCVPITLELSDMIDIGGKPLQVTSTVFDIDNSFTLHNIRLFQSEIFGYQLGYQLNLTGLFPLLWGFH